MRVARAVPIVLLAAFCLFTLIGACLVAWAPRPTSGAEFAAWVQAVGTVAAIIATAGVAWWVPYSTAKERREGLRRTAWFQLQACAEAVEQLRITIARETKDSTRLFGGLLKPPRVEYEMGHYLGMLNSFPLHDLPDGDVPSAFLRMHNCLIRAGRVVDAYNATQDSRRAQGREWADALEKISVKAAQIAGEFRAPPIRAN